MVWINSGSTAVAEAFQPSAIFSTAVASSYRVSYDTVFPSSHRLLMGYANDFSLSETTPLFLAYPSPYPVVFLPVIPPHWAGNFCFFVRSLRWGDSLPSLQITWDYWVP